MLIVGAVRKALTPEIERPPLSNLSPQGGEKLLAQRLTSDRLRCKPSPLWGGSAALADGVGVEECRSSAPVQTKQIPVHTQYTSPAQLRSLK